MSSIIEDIVATIITMAIRAFILFTVIAFAFMPLAVFVALIRYIFGG